MTPPRVFLLSPAKLGGERAQLLLAPTARGDLARRLRREGATLGEVMRFVSSLYFRGKLAYAAAFARPPRGVAGALVITPGIGLLDPATHVTYEHVLALSRLDDVGEPVRAAGAILARRLGRRGEAVLLGSVATDRYVAPLLDALGPRLLFPPDFIGRGDMSRGAMLLRAARAGVELPVAPVAGALRRGPRAPRLASR